MGGGVCNFGDLYSVAVRPVAAITTARNVNDIIGRNRQSLSGRTSVQAGTE